MKATTMLKKFGQKVMGPFIANSDIGRDFYRSASNEIRAEFAI